MPPLLALLLCSSFALFMLWNDRRQSPKVSRAVWVPTLWLISVSTKPLAQWFSYAGDDASGSPLDQRFIVGIICVGLFVLAKRRFDWRTAMHNRPWLMLFVGYMFLSLIWSDVPFVCFKRLIRQFAAVVMAGVVLSEHDPREAAESILRRTTYVLVPFSVLLIKYYPHLGVEFGRWTGERMWVGVATQKNGLGLVCMVAVLFLIWTLFRRWRVGNDHASRCQTPAEIFLLGIALHLLLTPEGKASATAIVALCVALCAGLALLATRRFGRAVEPWILVAVVMAVMLAGMLLPLTSGSFRGDLANVLGRDATFTGRTETWDDLLPIVMKRPVLGCGFDGYWTPATRELHRMSNAHNAYLDIFTGLGGIGLLLFGGFIVSLARAACNAIDIEPVWGVFCVSFLLMALVHGMMESTLGALASLLGGSLVFLMVSGEGLTVARTIEGSP